MRVDADLSGWLLLASVVFLLVTWARQKASPSIQPQQKDRRGARVVRDFRNLSVMPGPTSCHVCCLAFLTANKLADQVASVQSKIIMQRQRLHLVLLLALSRCLPARCRRR